MIHYVEYDGKRFKIDMEINNCVCQFSLYTENNDLIISGINYNIDAMIDSVVVYIKSYKECVHEDIINAIVKKLGE